MSRFRVNRRRRPQPPPRLDAWDCLAALLVVLLTLALYLPLAPHLPSFFGGRFGAYGLLSLGIAGAYHGRRRWWPHTVVPPTHTTQRLLRTSKLLGLAGLALLLVPIVRLPRLHAAGADIFDLSGEMGVMLVLTTLAPMVVTAGLVFDMTARRRDRPRR